MTDHHRRRRLTASAVASSSLLVAAATWFALPVAAHSGDVAVSQDCQTWSVTVTLANNVTIDRNVDVITTIPGTTGLTDQHYDSSYGQIWKASGPAVASGTVTLQIWSGQSLEFHASASLPQPEGCTEEPTPTPTVAPTPTPAAPRIDTEADETALVGQPFHDVAELSGGNAATGTISFTLYGPSATPSCTTANAIATVRADVDGNGSYRSPNVTVSAPGTYWWIARYNGDANNKSVRGPCGDDEESTVVSAAATPTPTVAPTPSPTATGEPASGTPTLPPTASPSGSVAPASGTPTTIKTKTLPPTDTTGPGGPAGQGPVLPLALLALGGLAFGITLLKPVPVRRRDD